MTTKVFRYLCLLTALANAGGNLAIVLFYRPILDLVGAPDRKSTRLNSSH